MKNDVTNNAKQERTRNLCALAAASLQALALTGQWSLGAVDQAIDDAEYMLERIEKGPTEEAEIVTEG